MNTQTDEDELQKAIDDITKSNSDDNAVLATPSPDLAVPPFPAMPENQSVGPQITPNGAGALLTGQDTAGTSQMGSTAIPMDASNNSYGDPDVVRIKEQALRDLFPLLEKMNINVEQKFRIYRDMIETLNNKAVIEPAYNAAKQIEDENKRAEALLYLINLIDELGIK